MKLRLGTTHDGKPFNVPIEIAMQTISLLGRKGSGKTNTATVIVEELLKANVRVVIIDPMGIWYGLRSSADGKRDGFPIAILGGDHGDIPLEAAGGRHVAEFVVKENLSSVIDVSEFGENEKRRFAADFLETFYRQNRSAMMLVVEEADEFAPQGNLLGKDAPRCLGAMQNIVRRGRARGIGCTLITQRSAAIAKDVLTQTECLVAMQTTAPHDLKAIEAWVSYHVDRLTSQSVTSDLPKFQRGQAWISSPGWLGDLIRVQFRHRETFDSSATPKPGETRVQPKSVAEVDLSKLAVGMHSAIEYAKSNDPKLLRARISELERRLSDNPTSKDAIDRARADWERDAAHKERQWREAVTTLQSRITRIRELAEANHVPLPESAPTSARTAPRRSTAPVVPAGESSTRSGGERRILLALAQHPRGLNDRQIGIFADLSTRSGTFSTYLGRLRTSGLVEGDRDHLCITSSGLESLGSFTPLPTGPELIAHWQSKLGTSGVRRMFDAVVSVFPKGVTKEGLGDVAGISPASGTFSTYLGRLKSMGLIKVDGNIITASQELFEG